MGYTKYRSALVSQANYLALGVVAYSEAQVEYPFVLGPGTTVFDQVDIKETRGRDNEADPLWIDEVDVDRLQGEVVENGISTQAAVNDGTPELDAIASVSLTKIGTTTAGSVQSIDADPKYFILSLWSVDDELYPVPPALLPLDPDAPMPDDRVTAFKAIMVANGADQNRLDMWFFEHQWPITPGELVNATPRTVGKDFAYLAGWTDEEVT